MPLGEEHYMNRLGGIKNQHLIGIPLANSTDQTIHCMILDLADALKEKGFTPKFFDTFSAADWASLSSQGVSSVICYGIGILQALDMASVLHGINIILVSLDHPVHCINAFRNFKMRHVGRAVYAFPTQSNLAFAKNLLGDADLRCLRHSAKAVDAISADRRSGRIVFSGNFTPEASIRSLVAQQEPTLLPAFDGAIERLCTHEAVSLEDAVAPFLKDMQGSTTTQYHRLCAKIDQHMRALVRRRALDSLQGLPVDLIGDGWNAVPLCPSIRLLGRREFPDVLEIIRNASIVINSTPYYYESHERMFEAAAAGTAIVTARNDYTNRLFSDCGALYDDEAEIGRLCAALLSDPSALESKGLNGTRLIQDQEGWSHRIDEIIAMLAPEEPEKSINMSRDMIINLKNKTQSLDISTHKLCSSDNIIINITINQIRDAVLFIGQTDQFIHPNARVSIIVDSVVPTGGFHELSFFLGSRGYQTEDVTYNKNDAIITFQKRIGLLADNNC
jgi:hypothetical protein